MEQHNSETRDNVQSDQPDQSTETKRAQADVLPLQQGALPDGGDFSSSEPVGGSKPDPISTGPNVADTIAGRN